MKSFGLIPKKSLGIDIGTSSVRLVEVSSWAATKKLENYAEVSVDAFYKKPFREHEQTTLLLSSKDIIRAIKAMMEEANIKSRRVAFSIPDYSTFFTGFELPPMSKEEVPQAVEAEARKHVPVPLAEVTLDWQIIDGVRHDDEKSLQILLVTVPNEIINQYQRIATELNLKVLALEAEVFGLMRALIPRDEKRIISLIDIGARSTSCSIIENRALKVSRSFDISGNSLIERISAGLSTDYKAAEELKNKYGILSPDTDPKGSNIKDILMPLIDVITREVKRVFASYELKQKKKVEKIILCGGNAFLPGLLDYFKNNFEGLEIEIANPFAGIHFPPILDEPLQKIGPSYAIAVGMALRGLE